MEPFQEAPSFSSSPTPRPPLSLVWRSLTSLFVAMWTRSPIYLFASCFLRRDASTAPTFSQRSFPPLSLSIPPPFVSPFSNDARFRTSAFPHLETFLEYFKLLLVLTHIFERKYFSRIVFNNIGREKNKQFKKRILIKKIYIYEYKEINIYSCHLESFELFFIRGKFFDENKFKFFHPIECRKKRKKEIPIEFLPLFLAPRFLVRHAAFSIFFPLRRLSAPMPQMYTCEVVGCSMECRRGDS